MAASDGANFQPAGGGGAAALASTITITPNLPVLERPDVSDSKELARAEKHTQEIIEHETQPVIQSRQQITPSEIRAIRARMWSETQLSMRQINQRLNAEYAGNPLLLTSDARAALNENPLQQPATPPEAPLPNGATDQARADAQGTDGRCLARMASRGGSGTAQPPPTPGSPPPPTPRGATPPTPPTVATATPPPPPPPPPVPAGTRGTPGMATAGNPPTDGTPATPESPTPLLPEQPLVATATTGLPASPSPVPGAPRRPEGMRGESRTLLGSSDPKGVGLSTETVDAFNTTVAKAQLLFRGGTMQAPVPVAPPRVANDTFVARTREPSQAGEGSEGEGEGRVGGSLDRSLALGMRRQMRDTAC